MKISDFKKQILVHFESENAMEKFLNQKEHFFSVGTHTEDLSPLEFLQKSRRKDKFDYVLKTIVELNQIVDITD